MKHNIKNTFIFFSFLLWMEITLAQQDSNEKYDIYYISIGSGHYLKPGYNRLEAVNSARVMSSILKGLGGKGYELLSREEANNIYPVTNVHMLRDIERLKNDIIHDKPKNPLIIFYYMGHGIGDKDGLSQYITFGDYDFKMEKANKKGNNFGAVFEITDIAMQFDTLNPNDKSEHHVLSENELNVINKINKKLHNNEFKSSFNGIEDIEKFQKEIGDEFGEELSAVCQKDYSGDCSRMNQGNGYMMAQSNDFIKAMKVIEKMRGKDVNDLSDEEKKELSAANEMVAHINDPANIERMTGMHIDLEQIKNMPNLNTFMDIQNQSQQLSAQSSINKKQIQEAQDKIRLLARGKIQDTTPFFKPTQKYPHVPYLIITDSCSSGLKGMSESMLEDNRNKTIINQIHQSVEQNKEYYKKFFNMDDKQIMEYERQVKEHYENVLKSNAISMAGSSQLFFAQSKGGIFKDNGALFFAANPGDSSKAFDEDDPFAKSTDKTGRLAKRFELAVDKASDNGVNVSLGEFVQLFSDDKPDGLQAESSDLPKPFTWFKLPEILSKKILIPSAH